MSRGKRASAWLKFLKDENAVRSFISILFTIMLIGLVLYIVIVLRPSIQDVTNLITLFGGFFLGYYFSGGRKK